MESGDVEDMTITEQMEFQKNTKTKVDVILDTDAYNRKFNTPNVHKRPLGFIFLCK